ncbi:hypothetical protein NLJ89_g500 [Agrocybe chaxingu]|uniref:DUF6534 domain-containing protein n=1 Tax=Agrocybe chaxingu TaxID=84603 RepID=A0A9W8N1U6_9AGAR|nr:hypothetical protein NLJ89_g500 [Agrocybe chaxingu]
MALDTTYGAIVIGLVVSAVLYGVTLLQTFFYFKQYGDDSKRIKFMVAFLWFLDTLHLLFCTITIYTLVPVFFRGLRLFTSLDRYLVSGFGDFDALSKSIWSMNLQTDCNGLIGLIVECYFARRLWISSSSHAQRQAQPDKPVVVSRNIYLTVLIVILACIHFSLGVYFTVQGFIIVDTTRFPSLIWVTSTGLGSAAAADIIIAVSMCYYLMKSRTGFARTDSLITTLMGYSLTTGLITSIVAFISVMTFATMPTNYIWLGFFWIIGKCYVNSVMAALSLFSQDLVQMGSNHQPQLEQEIVKDDKEGGYLDPGQALAVNVKTQTVTKTDFDYIISPVNNSFHAQRRTN